MKIKSGFIGILAMVFFNIFFFASSLMAETITETKIVVGEGGIHQQTITTETTKKVDWNVGFPENFNSFCMERMISDYKEGKIKPGYSRNCDFTTTVFFLDPLGFLDVPIMEKNWGVTIDDSGIKFNLIPTPKVEKNMFLDVMAIVLFGSSWFLLAGMNGYIGKSRKYLLSFFGLYAGAIYLLKALSLAYPLLVVIIFIISLVAGCLSVYHSRILDNFWLGLITFSAIVSIFIVSSSSILIGVISLEQANSYMIFQTIVFVYVFAFREVVYAWRKEKLITPEMVKATREFKGYINEENKSVVHFCGCMLIQ